MKIFVVGGAGYIGSVCSELLLNEGHEVAIFDNLSEGHRGALDSRTHFIEGELADRQQIEGQGDAPWPPHYRKQPGEAPRVMPSRRRTPASS